MTYLEPFLPFPIFLATDFTLHCLNLAPLFVVIYNFISLFNDSYIQFHILFEFSRFIVYVVKNL